MNAPPGLSRTAQEQAALEAAFAAMPASYTPRTHLMQGDRPAYINRLILEGAPYLLQHAHNPVDWWPWGEAALQAAREQDKPIFLSAGYATCHWCHVMEEESFDNVEVAAALNRDFIPIKLDRESRPDIDQIYILATTLQHRSAGWPNSVWLFPDGRPFHTGTYFQRPHFLQTLEALGGMWKGPQRAELDRVASQIAETVAKISARAEPPAELHAAPDAARAHLGQMFNPGHGGFSSGTQFPHEGYLLFLLDHWRRKGDEKALDMALTSLDHMVAGGLHDQIGGGFHRYTVDVNWRTPHFEKMLYNQALMLDCLSTSWHIAGRDSHARAAHRLVGYLLRDMRAPDGAFFTAEDADSLDAEGRREEGAFYCWHPAEAEAVLKAHGAIETLGLREPPTLEAGPVPHLRPGAHQDYAALDPALEALRTAREARPRPIRDEKVIAGWNGLMIGALARAGDIFDQPAWLEAAAAALDAVTSRLYNTGTLARYAAGGKAREAADLSDMVWLASAALALHEAGLPRTLPLAEELTEDLLARFTLEGSDRLALAPSGPLGPVYESEDGATPSAEASALALLARLQDAAPSPARRARARALRTAISGSISELPVMRLPALEAAQMLDRGNQAPTRFTAAGTARLSLARTGAGLRLRITCAPGCHLGGPLLEGAAPLALRGAEAALPGFETPQQELTLALVNPGEEIHITLQTCSDTICQSPAEETFRIRP